jgi:hypothetical protein
MKKSHYVFGISIGILIFTSIQSPVKADWGYGDCRSYHGITNHYGRYINNPQINFDGIVDETESWNRIDVYDYIIPMVNYYESSMRFKSYMHIKYIYDDTNLYILARWNDSTPVDRLDQLYFCWNMNCSNFTVNMFLNTNAMKTNEEGARVDCWKWLRLAQSNGSSFNLADDCYDSDDWIHEEENRETIASYTSGFGNDGMGYYQVEMKRPLLTNEKDVDVQFHNNSSVRFSTGVGDGMGSIEHAVSWTYQLYLTNATDPNINTTDPNINTTAISTTKLTNSTDFEPKIIGYQNSILISFSSISCGVLIIKTIQNRRKKL